MNEKDLAVKRALINYCETRLSCEDCAIMLLCYRGTPSKLCNLDENDDWNDSESGMEEERNAFS